MSLLSTRITMSSRALVTKRLTTRFLDASSYLLPCQSQTRWSSHSPIAAASHASLRKKVTLNSLRLMYKKNEPITMITAHDFPSGHVGDMAGMDMVLVGDSLAMVALGMQDTSEIRLEDMLLHCRSVARAVESSFTVCIPRLNNT